MSQPRVMYPIFRWYRNLIRDPRYRIWVILGTLAYLLSPIDIAPDLFPIVGQIDDIALLTILVSEISALLFGGDVTAESAAPATDPEVERDKREAIDVEAIPVDERDV